MARKTINIAIDGYSACGKSTLAKDVARKLHYAYVDSGAMYRAVTLYAHQNGWISEQNGLDAAPLIAALDTIDIQFQFEEETQKSHTYLNGTDVEQDIRQPHVANYVSEVAALPEVRKKLVALQQKMGENKGVVMDGRDIGTVVFPQAELKIFLTANIEVRVQRRLNELYQKGVEIERASVAENLRKRDHIDSTRDQDPLRKAPDALTLDNSYLDKSEQQQWVLDRVYELTR